MSEDAESTAADMEAGDGRGPGTLLREARTARGLSSAELAAELRLSEAQVDALEREEYSSLPPAPFVRGYLRSSARLLGIDADTLVAAYDAGADQPRDTRLVVPTYEEDRVAFSPKLALLLLLLLALGGAAAWWYWGDPPALVTAEGESGEPAMDVADAEAVEEPADPQTDVASAEPVEPATIDPPIIEPPEPAIEAPIIISPDLLVTEADGDADPGLTEQRDAEVEAMFEQIPVDTVTLATTDTPAGESVADEAEAADIDAEADDAAADADLGAATDPEATDPEATADTATEAATTAAETGPHELVLRIEGETWLEVSDDRDRRLAYALYAGEESVTLRGWAPFSVFLGNAPAVSLEFDGEPVDAGAFIRPNDTARFRVGDDGVTAP